MTKTNKAKENGTVKAVAEARDDKRQNIFDKLGATELRVRLTFTEEVLGTAPNDPEIHDNYIASLAPDALSRKEEIEAIGEGEYAERQMTVFSKTEDLKPFLWDYQIKGFFKDACKSLRKAGSSESAKVTSFKTVIDGDVFIKERKILFQNYKRIGECQRSLRADTPQGPRVALAHSETVPEGSFIEFSIMILPVEKKKYDIVEAVKEWLDYGAVRGLGQWRNSGKGTFDWQEIG